MRSLGSDGDPISAALGSDVFTGGSSVPGAQGKAALLAQPWELTVITMMQVTNEPSTRDNRNALKVIQQ